jgi:hypothetical protein
VNLGLGGVSAPYPTIIWENGAKRFGDGASSVGSTTAPANSFTAQYPNATACLLVCIMSSGGSSVMGMGATASGQGNNNPKRESGIWGEKDPLTGEIIRPSAVGSSSLLDELLLFIVEYRRPSSTTLANTLTEAGFAKPPGDGWEAHHIVFWGHSHADAVATRDILEEYGIDINSAENLVWLPRNVAVKKALNSAAVAHRGEMLHSYKAITSVYQQLSMGNSRGHGLAVLRKIKSHLSKGYRFWITE